MLNQFKIFSKIKNVIKSTGIELSTIIYIAITLVLAIPFSWWITTDIGEKVFEGVLGKVPFAEFIYKIYCSITGASLTKPNISIYDTLPPTGFYDTVNELSKLLVTTSLTALLFSGCLLLINLVSAPVKILDNLTDEASRRSMWIDEMEKRLDSVSYKVMETTIKVVITFGVNWLVKKIVEVYEASVENLDSLTTIAIAIGVFIIFFMTDSLLFAWHENKSIGAGMVKTCFFQLFPKVFTLFCTNIFFFAIYAIFHGSGITPRLVICTIILFILISFEKQIEGLVQHSIAGILLKGGKSRVTLIGSFCSFVTALPLMIAFYIVLFSSLYQDAFRPGLESIKVYPLIEGVMNNLPLDSAVNVYGTSFLETLVKLFFISLAIVFLLRLPILKNPLACFVVSYLVSSFVMFFVNLCFEIIFSKLSSLMTLDGALFTVGVGIWLTIGLIVFLITVYDFYLSLSCVGLTVVLLVIYAFLYNSGFLAGLCDVGSDRALYFLLTPGFYALSSLLRSMFRDAIMI